MNNYTQIQIFDFELPVEITQLENTDINWQEKLGCSIFTRKEVSTLLSKTDEYYVYLLWKMYNEKPIPFYVGKGHFDRLIKHEMPSDKQNTYKNKIISKHQKLGIEVGYSILSWHKDEKDALNREIKLILEIGRADLKQGTLTNKTDGGDGTRGHLTPKRGEHRNARPVYAMVNEQPTRFSCLLDCAEALAVDNTLILARIKNGWLGYYYEDEGQQPTIDKFRGFYRKAVHTPKGIFESLAEAGRQLNISHKKIYQYIYFGWKDYYYIDEGQRPRRRPEKAVKIAGIEFASRKEAAQAFEISVGGLKKRLESSNYPDWIDLSGTIKKIVKKQPFTAIWVDSIKFNSIVEAERVTGIKQDTLAFRARSSNYPDVKIDGVIKKQRSEKLAKLAVSVTVDGKHYKTLSDAARAIGIDINTVKSRCRSTSFPEYSSTDPDLQKKEPKNSHPYLHRIIVDGVHYRSINAAAQAVGITRDKLKGMALDNNILNVYFEI